MTFLRMLARILGAHPDDDAPSFQGDASRDILQSARSACETGDNVEALRLLDQALASGMRDPDAWSMRGTVLQALGWNLDAIDDFTVAIALSEPCSSLHFSRAMSRQSVGDREGCLADIEEAIVLGARDTHLERAYADTARELGYNTLVEFYRAKLRLADLALRLEIPAQRRASSKRRPAR